MTTCEFSLEEWFRWTAVQYQPPGVVSSCWVTDRSDLQKTEPVRPEFRALAHIPSSEVPRRRSSSFPAFPQQVRNEMADPRCHACAQCCIARGEPNGHPMRFLRSCQDNREAAERPSRWSLSCCSIWCVLSMCEVAYSRLRPAQAVIALRLGGRVRVGEFVARVAGPRKSQSKRFVVYSTLKHRRGR